MSCKGVCCRYQAQKPVGVGRYAAGQRRCQICEVFLKWEGLWCPCCSYRLRTRPRNLKYKSKLQSTNIKVGSEVTLYNKVDGVIKKEPIKGVLVKHLYTDKGDKTQLWKVKVDQEYMERYILPENPV